MKNHKRKKWIIWAIVVLIVLGITMLLTVKYYNAKNLAVASYYSYIEKQGVPLDDIKKVTTRLSMPYGKFETEAYYKSDLDYRYEYTYFSEDKETLCTVYSVLLGGNSGVETGMKYKTLK